MVRVIVERQIKKGKQLELCEAILALRSEAIKQPGYMMGETWVDVRDSLRHVVISSWIGVELWQAWENSPERQALVAKIEPLLASPSRTTVLRSVGEVEVGK
jgi:quinol monooxygenase YgiN